MPMVGLVSGMRQVAPSSRCVAILALHQLLTPLCATSFVPTLPLLLNKALGQPISIVGNVQAVFSLTCLVAFLGAAPLLRLVSPRAALLLAMLLRAAAGALHAAGCSSALTPAGALWLLYASRAMHGLSQLTFVVAPVWIGQRVSDPETRPRYVGLLGVAAMPGMILGPSTGSLLAGCLPTPLTQAAAPGWLTLALSVLALLLTLALFDDAAPLPRAPKLPGDEDDAPLDRALVGLVAWYMFFQSVGILAFESMLGLALYDMYDYSAFDSLAVWAPIAAAGLGGGSVVVLLQERLNAATLAVLWNVGFAATATLTVSWEEWDAAVPLPRLLLGACGAVTFVTFSMLVHLALLSARLRAHQQADYIAFVQACGQAGRCVAPLAAASVYSVEGHNGLFLYMTLMVVAAHTVPLCAFTHVYGDCAEPSRHARRAAAADGGTGALL